MLKFVPTINGSTQVEKTEKEKLETLRKVFSQFLFIECLIRRPEITFTSKKKRKGILAVCHRIIGKIIYFWLLLKRT